MLTVTYLFTGFLAGCVVTGELFTRPARRRETPAGCGHVWGPWGEPKESKVWGNPGDTHPIVNVYWQSRVCLNCDEMDYIYVA